MNKFMMQLLKIKRKSKKKNTEFSEIKDEEEETPDGTRNKRMKTNIDENKIESLKDKKLSTKSEEKNDESVCNKEDEEEEIPLEKEIKIEQDLLEPNEDKNSTYVTSMENLSKYATRENVERNLEKFRQSIQSREESFTISKESQELWQDYESLTQQMSKELCEQLRLILEPTICSKLKGDYKSGKRLNMKRVIEYIATEYRKDKIWLRRIKPNKRDYQVLLAIDNSSSMSDNHCIQLAYETIATITNALNFLEVGQLGLLKFGEKVDQLHDLQSNFNSDDGARLLSLIDFKDERTKIAEVYIFLK